MKKCIIAICALCIIIIVSLLIGIWVSGGFFGSSLPVVKTTRIEQGTIISSLLDKGVVLSEKQSPVYAQADGLVKEVLVNPGTRVTANQAILIFDKEAAQSNLTKAELKLESAIREVELSEKAFLQTMSLYRANEADKSQFESDQSWYKNALVAKKVAEDGVKSAQNHLQNLVYYSPQDGQIIDKQVNNNQFVKANQLLLTVADLNTLIIGFEINGQDSLAIKKGQEVVISKQGLKNKMKGYIRDVWSKTEYAQAEVSGTIAPDKQSASLSLNDEVGIRIITQKKDKVSFVASEAVYKNGKQNYVLLYQQGVVKKRVVRVGSRNEKQTEIIFGLQPNDQVILPGGVKIEPGMKVKGYSETAG